MCWTLPGRPAWLSHACVGTTATLALVTLVLALTRSEAMGALQIFCIASTILAAMRQSRQFRVGADELLNEWFVATSIASGIHSLISSFAFIQAEFALGSIQLVCMILNWIPHCTKLERALIEFDDNTDPSLPPASTNILVLPEATTVATGLALDVPPAPVVPILPGAIGNIP